MIQHALLISHISATVFFIYFVVSLMYTHRLRNASTKLYPLFFTHQSCKQPFNLYTTSSSLGSKGSPSSLQAPFFARYMSTGASSFAVLDQEVTESQVERIQLLNGENDFHGGVTVKVEEHMDTDVFAPLLKASLLHWKQMGKRGIWIKLPIKHAHLVESVVKEGFRYHHAEADYLMLVRWISDSPDTLPANASHRVGIGAFVMNEKGEVLVVQENSGKFKDTGIWKLPTGVINEGEDICTAAIREVKEETGIDTEFKEVLAFRQSHKSFFKKSDLFFVCMLQPYSSHLVRQITEIAAVKWMPIQEYATQPFVLKNESFRYVANICMAKVAGAYTGFAPISTRTGSGKSTYIYRNGEENLD